MEKMQELDFNSSPPARKPADTRSREEILRDCKLAIAQNANYGRQGRLQGSNPYDSRLGKPQRDVWGSHKRPT
jgi:hypothetical protein